MILDNFNAGGKERRFLELMKGLNKDKRILCEIIILEDIEKTYYKEIFKLDFKLHFLGRNSKYDFTIFKKLFVICKTFKPNLIHSWGSMSLIYILPIARLFTKHLIYTIADAPPNIKIFSSGWWRAKLTIPLTSIIIANSKAGLIAYNVKPKKGLVIHNGFDFKRIANLNTIEDTRNKFNIKHPIIIGMVANFTDNKDYISYVTAAQSVIDKRKDILFLAVGDGVNLEKIKLMVSEKYSDNIKFLGRQTDIESIVSTFDIGVLITNQDRHGEGISNSIMEYMALGKPVIATDSGGTCEILINGETGFLIKNKNVYDIISKINMLLNDKSLINKFGKCGNTRINEHFTIQEMISKYSTFYNSM